MKLKEITNQIVVWENWKTNYKKFVPQFINEALTKASWQDWDQDVFKEFFMRSSDQCVSSLTQGYFTNYEKEQIKKNWQLIAPLFRQIAASQDTPLWDVYSKIQKQIRAFTSVNRKAATYRLIAGLQPNLLCTVVNEKSLKQIHDTLSKKVEEKLPPYKNYWFVDSHNLCKFFLDNLSFTDPSDLITYPWQTKVFFDEGALITHSNDMSELGDSRITEAIELLVFKKQIILQGPPGTGKTRLAKKMAEDLIAIDEDKKLPATLTKNEILKYVKVGTKFPSAKNIVHYEVDKITDSGISIKASTGNSYIPIFKEIVEAFVNEVWDKEGAITKGNDSYSAAIAKYIFQQKKKSEEIDKLNQVKVIQFHPSYSYEDFVRGITVVPNTNGDGVLYEAQNKTLGAFANNALQNYNLSRLPNNFVTSDLEIFDLFIDDIKEKIADSNEQRYSLTEFVYLFEPDEKRFKYKGDNWIAHAKGLNMKFTELLKIISANATERAHVKDLPDVEELTKQHATYFMKVVEMYYLFKSAYNGNIQKKSQNNGLKNYVLIIDEINRANLSSVLGELIYALEYRNEVVSSIYAIDDNNELVLPPNLYIIGTMNTADRSVGHIDYAIRRRFAFIDVLPEKLDDNESIIFHNDLFAKISKLFISNYEEYLDDNSITLKRDDKFLSQEFDPKDVWLGHSYFIQKKIKLSNEDEVLEPLDFNVRIKYEIIPILREYVKDGILTQNAIIEINRIEKEYLFA